MRVKQVFWCSVLGAAALLSAGAARAVDDPPGRVGRLAETKGQVWLLERGQKEWTSAVLNRPLTSGERLATDANGRLVVQVGSSTIRLDERTDLEVLRLDDERIELLVRAGGVSVRVREHEVVDEVQLQTSVGRFSPRSTGLYRVDHSDRGSFAAVYSGEMRFDARDSVLTLSNGQRAEFWVDQRSQATHYSWATLPGDDFERWAKAEDMRPPSYAQSGRPALPEMTGVDDLDRYGRWDRHPEYGTIWVPTTVRSGWAPYRDGRWSWVAPWGWTWVDNAPWGFAPFHYGRWAFWGGSWCWVPGTYVRRPVYAPAMVAWVGGSHLSVSLSIGPSVGWVPLAPREYYQPYYGYTPRYVHAINSPYVPNPTRPVPPPGQPVMYTNQGVAGGVSVVPSNALAAHQVGSVAPRPAEEVMRGRGRPGDNPQWVTVAPPVPAGLSAAAATVTPVSQPSGRPVMNVSPTAPGAATLRPLGGQSGPAVMAPAQPPVAGPAAPGTAPQAVTVAPASVAPPFAKPATAVPQAQQQVLRPPYETQGERGQYAADRAAAIGERNVTGAVRLDVPRGTAPVQVVQPPANPVPAPVAPSFSAQPRPSVAVEAPRTEPARVETPRVMPSQPRVVEMPRPEPQRVMPPQPAPEARPMPVPPPRQAEVQMVRPPEPRPAPSANGNPLNREQPQPRRQEDKEPGPRRGNPLN